MSIKDLPLAARPREKLLHLGPAALADAELLALLLRTGCRGQGVLQMADSVLERFGGFAGLLHTQVAQLKGIKGLGPAKRAELAAVVEMARRSVAQRLSENPVFDAPAAVKDYVALQLAAREHECFAVLFLDHQHRLLTLDEMFPRHPGADQRVPARGGQARAGAERRGGDPGPQPPLRPGRTVARRRVPDPVAEKRAGPGGRARAGPPGGGPRRGGVIAERGLL